MDEAEIRAKLKIQMDNLGAEAAKAGKIISSGLASSVKGLGETSIEKEDRIARERLERERRERAARNRKLDEEDAKRDAERRKKAWDIYENDRMKREAQAASGKSQMVRAGMSLLGGIGLGVPGGGALVGLFQLNSAAGAVAASFKLLQVSVSQVLKSAEEARRYYAKSLYSGYGTNFTIKRSLLAEAIGVSENDVYQFGAAVNYMNGRLDNAAKVLSQANPILTATAFEVSILKEDFAALFAKLSVDMAPAINSFIQSLDKLVKWITEHSKFFTDPVGSAPNPKMREMAIAYANAQTGGAGLPFTKQRAAWNKALMKKAFELEQSGAPSEGVPPPQAFMKQMPASAWEKMGLVIGSAGGTNYAKNTADNTKKANAILATLPDQIAKALNSYMNKNPNGYSLPAIP